MGIYVLYTFNCIGMTINIFELNWIEFIIYSWLFISAMKIYLLYHWQNAPIRHCSMDYKAYFKQEQYKLAVT